MDLSQLIPLVLSLATPFVVKYAADLVVKWKPTLTGFGIVVVVVPLLGGIYTAVTQYTTSGAIIPWYWQFVLGLGAVFVNELIKQFNQTPVQMVKKLGAILFATLLLSQAGQAQGLFDDFWHPRPRIVQMNAKTLSLSSVNATIWEVKPSVAINLFAVSPSNVSGQPWVTGVISGVGPGLCLANTTQDLETGVNYINYSFTGSLIFGGTFGQMPVVGTSAEISAGFFNNLLSIGYKYDFYSPDNRKPWAIMVGTNIMPFLN